MIGPVKASSKKMCPFVCLDSVPLSSVSGPKNMGLINVLCSPMKKADVFPPTKPGWHEMVIQEITEQKPDFP